MNRKMTRLARGLKCGGRTASGLVGSMGVSAAWSRLASASRPNPLADRRNRSRRVYVGVKWKQLGIVLSTVAAGPQACRTFGQAWRPVPTLLHVHKLAPREQDLAERLPGPGAAR